MFPKISRIKNRRKQHEVDLDVLWSEARSGSEEALSDLFCVSYTWLFDYGYRIVPREAFVKDAIQELFLTLWEKRETINEARSVRSYLCSSLRRLIFRRIRKQKNRSRRNIRYKREVDGELRTTEELIIHVETDREKKYQLANALGVLSDRQKEAIFLKFYEGFTNSEIARIMKINKQSVYNHVSKAINKMQHAV